MSAIDKAALIEQAARASFMRPGMPLAHWERCNEDSREAFSEDAARSLPVIAKALLAPLRELHQAVEVEPSDTICGECSFQLPNGRYFGKIIEHPCPTLELLDAIEAEVQP